VGESVVADERRQASAEVALASPPGLLERDGALEAINDALALATGGGGGALFVVGPAGIGKTSVLAAARALAAEAGYQVAAGVGSPMEKGLPYGLVGQAVVALGGSAVDEVTELARRDGQSARLYRTFRFFLEAAAEAPLALTLDDLHWADQDSLELLGFVCRRLAGSRVLVLGGLRPEPDPAWRLAEELTGSGHARLLALEPLSRESASSLLGGAIGDIADRERLLDWCAGSPLLLKMAASAPGGGASLAGLPEDGFGRSLLLDRFVGLGTEAFAYVRCGSVFGVRFRPAIAGALARLDDAAWEAAHVRLVRAGLIDDLGGGWAAFVHPLFARALLDGLTPSERERAHERAFRLLVARGEPDAVAAEHAAAARVMGDPLAIEVAARAGREALAQGALETACEHLANAVELAGPDPRPELLLDYAGALAARARFPAVRETCDRLLAHPDTSPLLRGRGLALRALSAMWVGDPAEAQRLYEAAAMAVPDDPATQAAIVAEAALSCHVAAPVDWTIQVIARVLALLPAGSTQRPDLEFLLAFTRLMQGDASGVEFLKREMRRQLARTDSRGYPRMWSMATHAINACKLIEDPGAATELFEREFAVAIEDGAPMLIDSLSGAYADNAHRLGHLREALGLVRRAAALSDQTMAAWMDLALAALLTEMGEDEQAAVHIEAMRSFLAPMPATHDAPMWLWLDLLVGRRLLEAGEAERASDTMLHAAHVARVSGWQHPCIVPWAGAGIEAHLAAGRIEAARELIEDLDQLAGRLGCSWPLATATLGRAQLAASEGAHDQAEPGFEDGLRILDQLGMPIYRAEGLVSYGAYLRRGGRPREARRPLSEAFATAEHTGAGRVARLARAELAASGGRRRKRAHDRTKLTAQQQRVAELAAAGMSNAQIAVALTVSPKTVDNHLQQVYAKLGIHSRRELIRRAGAGVTPGTPPPAPR
jgi:ATP/maltotriose-dependent transcriptional regulator MalT